jgi:hypothetical protein
MRLPYLTGLQKIAGERSSTFVPDPDRLLEQVAGGAGAAHPILLHNGSWPQRSRC